MTTDAMYPFENTPYSDPIFPGLEVPSADPGDTPNYCLTYSHEWRPIILALLSRLQRRDAWLGDIAQQAIGVQKANQLLSMVLEAECPEGLPEGLCTSFEPENPFTTYFPQNPFTQPDFVPTGYTFPPFYTNVTNILLGIVPTDVVTDLLHFPAGITLPELIGFSFPTIHIDLEGQGEVELHFLKILQGGWVTVTIDGNPLTAKIVDLNAASLTDFTSILAILGVVFGGGLSNEHIEEIEFTTSGQHTIDIVFYPHVGGDVLLGFGGALRGIHFCDTTIDGDLTYMPITDMRVNTTTCKWEAEYNNDGMWVEIGDYFIPECEPPALPQTLIRADPSGCGAMQISLDDGENWSAITNTDYYRLGANCAAVNFYGKSDTARLHLETAAGVEQFRAGFKSGDATRNEIASVGRDLEINWGAATQRMYFGASDQSVHLDGAFPDTSGTKSAFRVVGRDSNYHVIRGQGRSGQVAAIIAAYSNNTSPTGGDMFMGSYAPEGFTFRVKQDGRMQYRGELTAINKPAAASITNVNDTLSTFADSGAAPLKGDVVQRIYDDGVAREYMHVRGESGAVKMGLFGAAPVAKQTINGDAEGNQLLFDLVAALSSYGLLDVTGVTLGLSCCASLEFCVAYDFLIEQYNSFWNYSNGNWIVDVGIGKDATTGRIDISILIDPDMELIEIALQGSQYVAGETEAILVSDNAAHNNPLIDVTPPPGAWNVGYVKIGVPLAVPAIYITITGAAESDFTLERVEIKGRSAGGIPEGGIDCS